MPFRIGASFVFAILATSRLLAVEDPVSFRNQVQPVLARAGCNAGACHGNLNGKGGFKLSLRGEDAETDLLALTRGMYGRRTDSLNPESSLILKKATGAMPHEGGTRFAASSEEYRVLKSWIADGCKLDSSPEPTKLTVTGAFFAVVDPNDRVRIRATAHFPDGRQRDVTAFASFELTNIGIARVLGDGTVIREQFGETVLIVRYLRHHVPVRIAFIPNRPAPDLSKTPANNAIDKLVLADLARLRMAPSELASDSTFLRRVYLDVCGITPSVEEVREYLNDVRADKRTALIERLLDRPEYATYWGQKWADLLRVEEKTLDKKGVAVFHRWLRTSIADDKPLTELAREIVTARGSTYANPPANFYRSIRDPYQRAESVAQVFLGLRIGCAKCHNHPFDSWTQDDYHRFAALFARIDYRVLENKRGDNLDSHEFIGEQIVVAKLTGELPHPRGGNAEAKILSRKTEAFEARSDRLAPLAEWIAAPENPFFAQAQANRVWAHLMGKGIVDPLDDFKVANPPSNPELLEFLAKSFAEGGYKLKPLIRLILNSRTYQLAASPNETNGGDTTHFSHALVRPLEAEQLLDAVAKGLKVELQWPNYPKGTRAGELAAIPSTPRRKAEVIGARFLKIFGKPERLLTCECERSEDPGVLQAFQMLTGELVNDLLKRSDNRLSSKGDDAERLDELFLALLTRFPSTSEKTKLLELLATSKTPRATWEDIAWGLLNSKEFLLRK